MQKSMKYDSNEKKNNDLKQLFTSESMLYKSIDSIQNFIWP
jgi:hypothetical protein